MNTKFRFASASLLVALTAACAFGQTWVRQSPLPGPWNLGGVAFGTDQHGFVVGDQASIYETFDAGVSWVKRNLGGAQGEPYYNILAKSPTNFFVFGNGEGLGMTKRTVDAGVNWTSYFLPAGSWYQMDFVSANVGFAGANGALVKTIDGGATWQIRSAYPNAPVVYGMDFRDENVGLVGGQVIGNEVGIYRTTDGGITWSLRTNMGANDVLFLDSNNVIAISGDTVITSDDAGLTWNPNGAIVSTGVLDLERVGATGIAGVSGKGDIWLSEDNGATWQIVFDGIGDLPANWAIHFQSNTNGWVVGQQGLIFRSLDGGHTWRQVSNGMGAQIYKIDMLDSQFGLAAGHNGYIFRTTDGGQWWDMSKVEVTGQIFGRDESLHAVSVVDRDFAVVAGPGGMVFRTEDGGDTWQNIGYPSLSGLFWIEDVHFVNRTVGWLVGLDQDFGHERAVFKTTDGGNTWQLNLEMNSYFFAADFVDENHGWLQTIGQRYFRTVDGGATWQQLTLPEYPVSVQPSDIDFIDQNYGWLCGWYGLLGKSTNGGQTWTWMTNVNQDDYFFAVKVVSQNEVWATGRTQMFDTVTYHTLNGGLSWQKIYNSTPSPEWFYTFDTAGGYAWGAGYNGSIFRAEVAPRFVPTSMQVLPGSVVSGTLASLSASDDSRLVARPGAVLLASQPPLIVTLETTAPQQTANTINFSVESHANVTNMRQVVQLYDFTTSQWATVRIDTLTTSDSIFEGSLSDGTRFIENGTRRVRARMTYKPNGPTLVFPWQVRIDQAAWSLG